ncbi:MAG TPA: hypothetical protein GX707_12400 [Epulopiscium sp.]|nr:hypothetical protein [Candidatus Epulonipiscium sp.]
MKEVLNCLVVGDSETGKSAFIRTFCEEEIGELLKISGKGQTTRCSCIYQFSNEKDCLKKDNVSINFYTKEEFTDKYIKQILNQLLIDEDLLNNNAKNIDVLKETDKSENEQIYDVKKIYNLIDKHLINDEFIKMEEFGLDSQTDIFITNKEVEQLNGIKKIYDHLILKLDDIYIKIKKQIETIDIVKNHIVGNREEQVEKNKEDNDDIKSLEFKLSEETKLLLSMSVKKLNRNEKRLISKSNISKSNISSISGVVKSVNADFLLNQEYGDICKLIGIKTIKLIDTFGLDHASRDGDITIDMIKNRFLNIFNNEFREIETVFFITPMVGKAAGANSKFKALIEAKRSIIPHIIYSKFDLYIEDNEESLIQLPEEEYIEYIEEFNYMNVNDIRNDFEEILKEYYSEDVVEYRKERILNNFSYFMGTYELDKEKRGVAKNNNIKYFKNIILSIFMNENYGIGDRTIRMEDLRENLKGTLEKNKKMIMERLTGVTQEAQKELQNRYNRAHRNTQVAFWRRISSNMLGFYGELNIRNILIYTYNEKMAKDSGEYRNNNLGSVIIDDFIKDNQLNVFTREVINRFGGQLFCAGCSPCEQLRYKVCDMSKSCNTTGRTERVYRQESCQQYRGGETIGSRPESYYCANRGIDGISLYNEEYGEEKKCKEYCYWSGLSEWRKNNSSSIQLSYGDIWEYFSEVFEEFFMRQYIIAKQAFINVEYLMKEQQINYAQENGVEEIEDSTEEKMKLIKESNKDIILLTEGPSDKIHILNAWKVLGEGEMPFEVFSLDGAGNFFKFLPTYPVEMCKSKIFIGVLDNDEAGKQEFDKFKENNSSIKTIRDNVKRYKNLNGSEKDRQYFILKLPFSDIEVLENKFGCIEFYYGKDILIGKEFIQRASINKILVEYLKNEKCKKPEEVMEIMEEVMNSNELAYFEVNNKFNKMRFANESIKNFNQIAKKSFDGLFELINDIIKLTK